MVGVEGCYYLVLLLYVCTVSVEHHTSLAGCWLSDVCVVPLQVFSTIVLIELFGSPFMRNAAVVIALLFGYLIAAVSRYDGKSYVSTDGIKAAPVVTFLWVKTFPLGEAWMEGQGVCHCMLAAWRMYVVVHADWLRQLERVLAELGKYAVVYSGSTALHQMVAPPSWDSSIHLCSHSMH